MALFWKRKTEKPEFDLTEGTGPADEEPSEESQAAPAPGVYTLGPAEPEPSPASTPKPGLFGRFRQALSERLQKTKDHFVGQLKAAIKAAGKVDEDLIDNIEEILIKADLGGETTMRLVDRMKEFEARGASSDEMLDAFKSELLAIVGKNQRLLSLNQAAPHVVLVIGVNGTGKTTTIGKIAKQLTDQNKRVLLAAGDTFRAAAIEQLTIWARQTGSEIVAREMGSDPSGLMYDAVQRAKDENFDVLLIDTAGRLHTKTNLMEELKKVVRVIQKVVPDAPHDTLLVLDATTGQNAIAQARIFSEAIPTTGIVMTKLDGTAKGGVLIGIRNLFDIPVVKIGVGESPEDLRDFDAKEFVDALFEE